MAKGDPVRGDGSVVIVSTWRPCCSAHASAAARALGAYIGTDYALREAS